MLFITTSPRRKSGQPLSPKKPTFDQAPGAGRHNHRSVRQQPDDRPMEMQKLSLHQVSQPAQSPLPYRATAAARPGPVRQQQLSHASRRRGPEMKDWSDVHPNKLWKTAELPAFRKDLAELSLTDLSKLGRFCYYQKVTPSPAFIRAYYQEVHNRLDTGILPDIAFLSGLVGPMGQWGFHNDKLILQVCELAVRKLKRSADPADGPNLGRMLLNLSQMGGCPPAQLNDLINIYCTRYLKTATGGELLDVALAGCRIHALMKEQGMRTWLGMLTPDLKTLVTAVQEHIKKTGTSSMPREALFKMNWIMVYGDLLLGLKLPYQPPTSRLQNNGIKSDFQMQAGKIIKAQAEWLKVKEEIPHPNGLSVDYLIDNCIAVEVDGVQYHKSCHLALDPFSSFETIRDNGKTVMKRQMLLKMGVEVFNINSLDAHEFAPLIKAINYHKLCVLERMRLNPPPGL